MPNQRHMAASPPCPLHSQAVASPALGGREGGFPSTKKPEEPLFLTVISTDHPKYLTGKEIEHNTKIDTDACDGHVPHHFFSEEEMMLLFEAFEILSIEHYRGPSELDPAKELAAWELRARKPMFPRADSVKL